MPSYLHPSFLQAPECPYLQNGHSPRLLQKLKCFLQSITVGADKHFLLTLL